MNMKDGWIVYELSNSVCQKKRQSRQGAFRVPTALILEFNDKIFSFKPGALR